jgi:uncharacterized protein YbaP (TraB family)
MPYSRSIRVRLVVALALASALPAVGIHAQAPRAAAKNFLWKVESGTRVLYLAGSIHALNADVFPLNPAFERAFAASSTLVEEIDLGEAATLAAGPMLLSKGLYQDGRTFEQAVSKDTAALLGERATQMGLPLEMLRRMKPWMITLTLTALQVGKAGLETSLGLDKYFFDKAAAGGKTLIGLETAEFQIDRFDRMSDLTQEQMLRNTLDEIDAQPSALKEMVAAWQAGDAAFFEKTVVGGFAQYPAAYASLIVERNRAWLPQLDACLARPTPCFVVVGAAHLVGPDGLLALLRRKGYRVEQQ